MSSATAAGYALGYSESERRRLEFQANVVDPTTRDMLLRAGLKPGMRVLDIGCGLGAVSAVAAGIVGPEGAVVGVDRSDVGFASAIDRLSSEGVNNVRFVTAEIPVLPDLGTFDALIGRYILLYFKDPGSTLRTLLQRVVPGGIVAFQELVLTSGKAVPPTASVKDALDRVWQTYERAGLQADFGSAIGATYSGLGLKPHLMGYTFMEQGGDGLIPLWIAEIVRSLLPTMTAVGLSEGLDVETLEDRIRTELTQADAQVLAPMNVCCWATT